MTDLVPQAAPRHIDICTIRIILSGNGVPHHRSGVVADTWGTDDTLPNAIDAHVIWDKERCYLVYGSFFGGIYIKELNAKTGLALDGNEKNLLKTGQPS